MLIGILQYMINGTDMYYVVLHLDNSTTLASERIIFSVSIIVLQSVIYIMSFNILSLLLCLMKVITKDII